jgi:hypothetical protein
LRANEESDVVQIWTGALAVGMSFVMKGTSDLSVKSNKHDKKEIQGKGTVKYLSFEGGFYGIVGDDSKQYGPLNLSPEFRVDSLLIRFTALVTDRVVSFRMWGYIVKLVWIERLL